MCSECGKKLIFALNEIEYRVYSANQRLSFGCETCGHNVTWKPVPNQPELAAPGPASAEVENRKHASTRMKAMACIQESGRDDDIVEVSDISRGGVSFRAKRVYPVNSWIQFAVPYTPGAANIFVSGRIAWRKDLEGNPLSMACSTSAAKGTSARSISPLSASARDSASSNTETP